MKTKILSILLASFCFGINAQNKIESTGNVGIGTTNPSSDSDLHIKDSRASLFIENTNPSNWSFLRIKGSGSKFWDIAQYGDNDLIEFRPNGSTPTIVFNQNGNIGIGTNNPTFDLDISSSNSNIRIKNTNPSSWAYLRIHGSGSKLWDIAQYGDNDFLEFRPNGSTATVIFKQNGNAAIQGKLEAKEIKVTLTPTADFVFNEIYELPSLDFIESYIKKNKHLPEIASAEEMKEKGVNVGNFQIKLLQKIEELTLYTIQQEKQLKNQNKEIQKVKKENESLKTMNLKLIELQKRLEKLEKK